jgi:hypothetical protein
MQRTPRTVAVAARTMPTTIGPVMGHAVHYRTSTGEARLDEVDSLEDALAMVDHLRNDEGVSDVRVYREVPITFRTYYKAAVADDGAEAPAPATVAQVDGVDAPPGAMPLSPPVVAARAEEASSPDVANLEGDGEAARKGLFSRT